MGDATVRQRVLDALPDLGGSAAKVLLHRLFATAGTCTTRELLAATGLSKPTYLAACRELERRGLGQVSFPSGQETLPPPVKKLDQADKKLDRPGQETLPGGQETLPGGQETFPQASGERPADADEGRGSLVRRAVAADRMDAGGNPTQRGSAFQARRRAQLAVLQDAWGALGFAGRLSTAAAKDWLVLSGDCAEAVLEVLTEVAEKARAKPGAVKSPWGLVSYLLKQQQRQPAEAQAGPPAQAQPGGIIWLQADEAYRARQRRMEALARKVLAERAAERGEAFDPDTL